jgi:hypothetical protein
MSASRMESDAGWLEQLLLFGCRLFSTKTCVSPSREFGLELFDTAGGVNELQFACVERMAYIANVDAKFFANAASLEGVAATASDFGFVVVRMDIVFHDAQWKTFACVERQCVD